MQTPRCIFIIVLALMAACQDQGQRPQSFVLAGAPTTTQITLTAVSQVAGQVVFHLLEDSTSTRPSRSSEVLPLMGEASYSGRYTFDRLASGRTYYYLAEVQTAPDRFEVSRGKFTTLTEGPFSYTIALASCAQTGSTSKVFTSIQKENPLFFLQMGDLHYENIRNDCPSQFADAYHSVFTSRTQAALYASTPLVYMWDDHDFGPNNSAGDAPCKEVAIQAYRHTIPHYTLAFDGEGKAISQAFSVGRIRYLLTDLRSQKVRPEYSDCERIRTGSVFGSEEHLRWFFFQLLEAKIQGQVVAWVSGIPWINAPGGPRYKCQETDNWGGYPEERERIANFIRDNAIPLFILSGDAHMLAIDDGTHSDYASGGGAALPVFHAAPLDRPGSLKGGPYSHGMQDKTGQYGMMNVEDFGGEELCIEWIGKDASGKVALNKDGKPLQHRFCWKI
jgi:phosphodiesterase/alkaline phosphatase D-like protein